ncbi:rhodanese-like domain-containing protein [Undibacterium rugosum]|uniref:Rhodanese-like domain-containing protein n=1 Tax=Undibacterium rugosum TaxID=2762291 RepID=A0A923I1D4_9BURK|nr:rhodanese-like domain-containing protein [Undibacterium rugosum]MBC3934179.1 rhodanese-like domain-containing protein [Undibacterium rugosum]MBR7779642.1 rhodanese-like domain-containing protein [Undibacterium rugosum]
MKFIIDNIFLIGIALISGGALFFPMLQRRGAKVTQLQATQYINQGKTLILDVRNAEEFTAGHLPNAKHIPLPELNNRLKEIEKSKNQVVITVCASGVRSSSAASILAKAGFTQVFSLEGGTNAWREQGLPITK